MEQQIASMKSQINSLPKGGFFCSRNGKYFKWYHTDGKHQTLIPKKQRAYAEQLVQRKYLLLKLEELKKKKDAVNAYISALDDIPNDSEELFYKNEEYKRLLATMFVPENQELLYWTQEPYDKNTIYPDFTIRHPMTGETFYWEHFGIMDDSQYCNNALSKLQRYVMKTIETYFL